MSTDPRPAAARARVGAIPAPVQRASLYGSAAAIIVYLVLASAGRLALMQPRFTSDFYDIQARRLLDGHLTVPAEPFRIEAFVVNGQTHTYFGVLPAFLRMPVLLVTSSLDGRSTQVSMAVAFAVLLWFTTRISWQVRGLVRHDAPVDQVDMWYAALAPFLVGAGSVAPYLGATPVVYHEAILWGIAAAGATAAYLVEYLVMPSPRALVCLGVALTSTLLSRPSIGFGAVASVSVVFAAVTVRALLGTRTATECLRRTVGAEAVDPSAHTLLALGAVIALPMALYVGINEARFSRAFGPPYAEQVWSRMNADRRAALDANGGSLFNMNYVPSTALAYLRPDGLSFVRLFPFVDFPPERATVIGNVVFDTRDRTASIPATMPAITTLAIGGAWVMIRRRRRDALAPLRPLIVGGVVGVAGVLSIGFIAHRYVGDFVPLLVPLALTGLLAFSCAIAGTQRVGSRHALCAIGVALVCFSVWVNAGLGLIVQRAYWAPDTWTRHGFLTFQQSLDERIFGAARYVRGDIAPTSEGTRGDLFVVGECEELYWHDSSMWVRIEPLDDGTTPLCLRLLRRARSAGGSPAA